MRIQLLFVAGCPNAPHIRDLVHSCVKLTGARCVVEEIEGEFPSPSAVVDGMDVMGKPLDSAPTCRLDLPTSERVLAAIRAAMDRDQPLDIAAIPVDERTRADHA